MASALTMLAPKIKPLTLPNERAFTDGKPWFCIYELLTDLVWSRWLNIDQVLFMGVYGPRQSPGP